MARLVPIYFDEVVPGDVYKVNTEVMVRLAPMIAPVMHEINVYVHYFFVPSRILWTEFKNWYTGGPDGTSKPVLPTIAWGSKSDGSCAVGSLGDYLGLPTTDDTVQTYSYNISELPFRAYTQIYNDYYRDQTLTTEVDITDETEIMRLRLDRDWET